MRLPIIILSCSFICFYHIDGRCALWLRLAYTSIRRNLTTLEKCCIVLFFSLLTWMCVCVCVSMHGTMFEQGIRAFTIYEFAWRKRERWIRDRQWVQKTHRQTINYFTPSLMAKCAYKITNFIRIILNSNQFIAIIEIATCCCMARAHHRNKCRSSSSSAFKWTKEVQARLLVCRCFRDDERWCQQCDAYMCCWHSDWKAWKIMFMHKLG